MMNLPKLIISDVGHGNCAILQDTNGVAIFDCALGSTLLDTLDHLNINEINAIYISHADKDHIGGLISLLNNTNIKIHKIYLNSDSSKTTDVFKALIASIKDARTRYKLKIIVGLTTETDTLECGEVNIEILFPTPEMVISGVGSDDIEGRAIYSNTISTIIRLVYKSIPFALLTGDMDGTGYKNLIQEKTDIKAEILVFPHHGGKPRNVDAKEFAKDFVSRVNPNIIIFSIGRGLYDNPKPEIIEGIKLTIPNAHIICTQLSNYCSTTTHVVHIGSLKHLTNLPAKGKLKNHCCGGTIVISFSDDKIVCQPLLDHKDFVKSKVMKPLCRNDFTINNP